MEASRTLFSSSPPFSRRTHLKNSLTSSVLMNHEPTVTAVTSVQKTSTARHFPTSVLLQEQRDELRPLLNTSKEDRTSQAAMEGRSMDIGTLVHDGKKSDNLDQLVRQFERQLLHWPNFFNLGVALQGKGNPSMSLLLQSAVMNTNNLMDVEPTTVSDLGRKAFSASKEGPLLADSLETATSSSFPLEGTTIVRSTRRIERRSKSRRVPKSKDLFHEPSTSKRADVRKKIPEGFDRDDHLRLFFSGPESAQLLTAKEESELIAQVQELMNLEGVKSNFESQIGRELTVVEWAQAAEISCPVLRTKIHSGNSSRDRLISANLRLVVHVAKKYQGRGLDFQDLLQAGSMGLMKSVEKFNPDAGSRFASYAYWWIRDTIKKAIFHHSRLIRLPVGLYNLLGKVNEAERLYVQEGNHHPTEEELAKRAGISVEKLERLQFLFRVPVSLQQRVWADQDTTFEDITEDAATEDTGVSAEKQLMRRHVNGLLNILSPKEKLVIKLRFGFGDGVPRSLSEIGNILGFSKERVRQLESRAMYRLKQCRGTHGLDAYKDLLV